MFENYTPHTINLNNGQSYPSLGLARVSAQLTPFNAEGICGQEYGEILGLPALAPASS